MSRNYFQIGFLLLLPLVSSGQNSLDFRQFYFNPFLYNPAYAGYSGHSEFAIVHRQQWVNFEDSPVTSGFSFQDPNQKKISLGFNVSTQKSIALRTTSVGATVAYAIHLTSKQTLRLALSGGMGINDFDLEGRDYSNDPLILEAAQNSVFAESSFGILYSVGELAVGVALPTLINNQETGSGILRTHPQQQLLNQLYSVRYKFKVSSHVAIEPYFLYRLNRDQQNYWEAATLVHYKDKIWIGSSYQQYNGLAFYAGFTVNDKFRLGYDYEVPTSKYATANSHEVQMSFRLRDKREE